MKHRVLKILRNLLFLLSIPLMLTAFVFASKQSNEVKCNHISVHIHNPDLTFIHNDDVMDIVQKTDFILHQTPANEIKLNTIEEHLVHNEWIEDANAYVDVKGDLYIDVYQRRPVLRVIEKNVGDAGYFLDHNAQTIELNEKYITRLPVATVPIIGQESLLQEVRTNLVTLAEFIQHDTFWNAAIGQIDVMDDGEIQLVSVFTNHTIRLGNTKDLDDKLERLRVFFKEGMTTVQWDLYDEIDVRFAGQVIGRNTHGKILAINPYDKKPQTTKPVASNNTLNTPKPKQNDTKNNTAIAVKKPDAQPKVIDNKINKSQKQTTPNNNATQIKKETKKVETQSSHINKNKK